MHWKGGNHKLGLDNSRNFNVTSSTKLRYGEKRSVLAPQGLLPNDAAPISNLLGKRCNAVATLYAVKGSGLGRIPLQSTYKATGNRRTLFKPNHGAKKIVQDQRPSWPCANAYIKQKTWTELMKITKSRRWYGRTRIVSSAVDQKTKATI